MSKASDINDTILINRFKKLKETNEHYNANDNDDDDDNNNNNGGFINPLGPVLSPLNFNNFPSTFQTPQQPFSQPKQQESFDKPSTTTTQHQYNISINLKKKKLKINKLFLMIHC